MKEGHLKAKCTRDLRGEREDQEVGEQQNPTPQRTVTLGLWLDGGGSAPGRNRGD